MCYPISGIVFGTNFLSCIFQGVESKVENVQPMHKTMTAHGLYGFITVYINALFLIPYRFYRNNSFTGTCTANAPHKQIKNVDMVTFSERKCSFNIYGRSCVQYYKLHLLLWFGFICLMNFRREKKRLLRERPLIAAVM